MIFNIASHHHHHHHVSPSAQISLTLSPHPSLSSIASARSSGLHPVYSTELLYVGSNWSSSLCSPKWRGPQEYVTYVLVLTSPAMSRMSGSSNLDNFRDRWSVAGHLLLCDVLPPGLVQYCSQHSRLVAVKLFPHNFS